MKFKFLRGVIDYDRHNTTWKTAKGRMMPIFWMTNNHINNCLNCLKGNGEMEIPDPYMGKTRTDWINIFECELSTRREENRG